jgi:hypothetical protein
MVRIAITRAAFQAVAKTLPLGSAGYENATNDKGERLIWLDPSVVDRLRSLRSRGESYSDVVTTHQFNSLRERAGGSLTVCPPPEEALTRLVLSVSVVR